MLHVHVWEGVGGMEGSLGLQLCFLSKQIARGWRAGLHDGGGKEGGWGIWINCFAELCLGLERPLAPKQTF